MPTSKAETNLSIVVTVVSGKDAARESLARLCRQIDADRHEMIVPWDKWSTGVGELLAEFSTVKFHFIEDLGAASAAVGPDDHRLYDRRRAVGLDIARGKIVAMIEDRGLPADDWVEKVIEVHKMPYAAIGGAVENDIDLPVNRALYYCDFGRYGRPLKPGEAAFISDVNVSYKSEALMAVRDVWNEAYHEQLVHSALNDHGEKLYLDDRPVVCQRRPPIGLLAAFKERIQWGRVFARTRVRQITASRRLLFAAGSCVLPLLILLRVFSHMRRQKITTGRIVTTLAVAIPLSAGWSIGEFFGYVTGERHESADGPDQSQNPVLRRARSSTHGGRI